MLRDARSIARARVRVVEARIHNVSFMQCDVNQIASDQPFDAAVGRFILMFVPDPVAVLRSLSRVVRPGGVLAFQEPSWAPGLAVAARLPLWHAAVFLNCETLQLSGANTEMGIALYPAFQEAGLPAPSMTMEVPLGNDPDFVYWIYEVLCSLRPQIEPHNPTLQKLGDFEDLPKRLQSEVTASKTVVNWMALVGAWSRKPSDEASRGFVERSRP